MTRHHIANRVREIVAEHLKVPLERVTDDATLDSLGADSLDHIEITFELEQAFDVEIGDDEAEQNKTVSAVIDWLAARLGVVEAA